MQRHVHGQYCKDITVIGMLPTEHHVTMVVPFTDHIDKLQ